MARTYDSWMSAGLDAWSLGIEATGVIGMRVAKIATGGDPTGVEARLMVTEKIESAWELGSALAGLTPLAGTRKALRHYGRKVAANRRRLAR